jgi:hypothetical protein
MIHVFEVSRSRKHSGSAQPKAVVARPTLEKFSWFLAPLCICLALWIALPAHAQWQPYEIGIANREAGRLRALAERLSKRNLLYQLHLANVKKLDMHVTANELDRILELLRSGSAFYSIAGPPNDDVRARLGAIEQAWSPVRQLALASPYDYLRRAQQFIPPESPRGDPLIVKSFDKMTGKLINEIEELMLGYYAVCVETAYPLCAVALQAGQPTMLVERMMKDIVFVHAGLGTKQSGKRLADSRDTFETNFFAFQKTELYRQATDQSRGKSAQFVVGLRKSITTNWATFRAEVDLAIAGRANEVDLVKILRVQREMVTDLERFTAVLGRFAAGRIDR